MANEQTHQQNQDAAATVQGRRRLSRQWWIALVIVGFLSWALVAAMGLVPLWLWVLTIAMLLSIALAIALFAPRRIPR